MPRIRTIKPEFFRDEDLQDLEAANPGAYCMLVFSGLWGHCDKSGVFEWKPRTLKLDILPFLEFNMVNTLDLLEGAGFVERFEVDGKQFGYIPTFESHQRINGKEAQEESRYPVFSGKQRGSNGEATGKQRGSNGEATGFATKCPDLQENANNPVKTAGSNGEALGKHWGSNGEAVETTGREGKGREEEEEEEVNSASPSHLVSLKDSWQIPERLDCPDVRKLLDEFAAMRQRNKKRIKSFADASRVFKHFESVEHLKFALDFCIANGYQGLKPEYRPPSNRERAGPNGKPKIDLFAQVK